MLIFICKMCINLKSSHVDLVRHTGLVGARPYVLGRNVLAPKYNWSRHKVFAATNSEGNQDGGVSKPEETLKKYGLEAGLFQIFTSKDSDGKSRGQQAKGLLKRYGSAYLITSISFAIVSFAACYALVSAGVDVASLLSKVGLQVSDTSERVGTFAIAYAAHKALSPVRFPPTVALTPVVAKWVGKDGEVEEEK